MSAHDTHAPTRADVLAIAQRPTPPWVKTAATGLAAIGFLVFVGGLFVDADRTWRAFHYNWLFFATLSSAGATWAAVQRITTARWSRPIVRFWEGYAAFLPVAFVFLLLILFVGRDHIFPWTHVTPSNASRVFYLQPTFLVTRDLVVFGILTLLAVWFVYTAVRLDVGGIPEAGSGWAAGIRAAMRRGFGEERREIHSTHSRQGKIAVFAVLAFGFGWPVLAWDLSMTLDLHFASTMYGWQYFMTGWVGAVMTVALLTMWWRQQLDARSLIVEKHFHDLGKLCFAFTAFWGYLTFAQFLVIWYANMGEETHFLRLRLIQPWFWWTTAVGMLVFVLPFFGLISKAAKLYLPTFVFFACCSILGTYLQRYVEVYPSLYGVAPTSPFGVWEIGVTLFYLGVWGICYFSFMDAFPKMRVVMQTSPYRDEIQVPVNPRTMEPLPAHE
ncbi:MAG TPA: hypothetical protein VNW46_02235 [Gemmatimonadaceae bacterium]|nr:hypothetical protein [Gemmatimonadaceae bacterium]